MAESSRFSCCLWGCLAAVAAVLLIAATIGVLAYFGFESQASVRARGDAFLDALDRSDWGAAYEMLSPEWQERMSPIDFARLEEDSRLALGELANRALSGLDMRKTSGRDSAARLSYKADSQAGPLAITLSMERIDESWLITAVDRSSVSPEAVPLAVTCPSCGAVSPPDHVFCPSCGARLRPLEQAE